MNGSNAPSLDDLSLFATVVRAGGFSAAAKLSGRPQATISRRIAMLEANLGVQLLERTTRRLELTEAGRRVLEHAKLLHNQADAARLAVSELSGSVAGPLKIAAPLILGRRVVTPVVASFLAERPEVAIRLDLTSRRFNPAEDDIDIAIQLGNAAPPDLVRVKLGQTRVALFAAPGYAGPVPEAPPDLAEMRVAGLGRDLDGNEIVFYRGAEKETVRIPRLLMSNDIDPVLVVAEACGCLAVLPDFCAPEGWRKVMPDWTTEGYDVIALRTASRGALPKVRLFLDALKEAFRDPA